MTAPDIKLYSLSTCSHCRYVKRYLDERGAEYEAVDVDLLDGEQRKSAIDQVRQYNHRVSFPTTVIGDRIVIGNKREEIDKALVQNHETQGNAACNHCE